MNLFKFNGRPVAPFGLLLIYLFFSVGHRDCFAFGDPNWVKQGKDPLLDAKGYLQGIGWVRSTGNPEKDYKMAENIARAELAKRIVVTVEENSVDLVAERFHNGKSESLADIRSEVKTSVNLTLDGVEIRHYPEKLKKTSNYYALAYLKPEDAAKKIGDRLRLIYQSISQEKKLARAAIEQKDVRRALLHHARARWQALQASGHAASYEVLRTELEPSTNHLAGGDVVALTSGAEWADLLSRFQIVAVKGQSQKVSEGDRPSQPLVAKLVLRDAAGEVPISGLPVRFQLMSGDGQLQAGVPVRTRGLGGPQTVASAVTDQNGEVACEILKLNTGPAAVQMISVTVDIAPLILQIHEVDAKALASWLLPLTELKTVFLLERPGDKELSFPQWVGRQVKRVKTQKGWPSGSNILIGAFSYRDSRASGEFGQRLEREFRNAFAADGTIVVRTDRSGQNPILRGEYWEDSQQVEVRTYLEDQQGTQFVSVSAFFDRSKLGEMKLKPDNFAQYKAAVVELSDPKTAVEEDFSIKIWSDRGTNPVYQKDEKMMFYLRSTRDCYLRLLFRTVDGTHAQIYPNKWGAADQLQANRVYAFPAGNAGFEFVVQEPFGAEIVKAIASTSKLPQLEGEEAGGIIILNESSLMKLMRKLRKPDFSTMTRYSLAEDQMVVNTVP